MTPPVRPPPTESAAPGAPITPDPSSTADCFDAALDPEKDKSPAMRVVVERRTRGLVWTERLGCALATSVAVIPLGLFCSAMVGLLQSENGVTLLLLSLAMVLGASVSIFAGMAISVFVWWVPRLVYLALNPKLRRTNVRVGVRSRGIWISGLGWLSWNGLHLREKGDTKPGMRCSAMVIKSPEHGELVLRSGENVPALLKQVRRFLDAQSTEFQITEMMPEEVPTPPHRAKTAS